MGEDVLREVNVLPKIDRWTGLIKSHCSFIIIKLALIKS